MDLSSDDLLGLVEPDIQPMEFGTVNPHAESAARLVGDLVRDVHLGDGEHVAITCTRPDDEQLVALLPGGANGIHGCANGLLRDSEPPHASEGHRGGSESAKVTCGTRLTVKP